MFLLEGLPAIALAALVLVTLQDHPNAASWLNSTEKDWLTTALEDERQLQEATNGTNIWAAFVSWRVWLSTIVYFGLTTSAYGIILWLPSYIHSLSTLGNLGIGIVSVVPYVATAVAMVVIGTRSDRTGSHRLHLTATALSAAVFLFIAAYTSSIIPGLAFVGLALMATFSMQGPFWASATSLMTGTAAAAGIALINSFGNLGGFFGPYIIGARRSSGGGFREGMLIITAFLALAGILAFVVRPPAKRPSSLKTNPLQ
jgi:ACS family tartrate transporter-like MFS transporter